MSDWSVNAWLRRELPKHTEVLTRMREQLSEQLAVDLNEHGTASRDWCRLFQRYAAGMATLLAEEREKTKLQLMARLKGAGQVLTDDEFEQGMRDLAVQAVKELPTADLAQELMRRGLTLPSAPDGDGGPQ